MTLEQPDSPPKPGDEHGDPPSEPNAVTRTVLEAKTRIQRAVSHFEYRFFPERWGRRRLEEDADFHVQRDAASFAAAKIPNGEEIGVRCVWVMEVYLASHISQLVAGLRSLGLDRAEIGRGDPVESILATRSIRQFGRRITFNLLVPRDQKRNNWHGITRADLPVGVRSTSIEAITIVPSATVLVAQFRFDEPTARGIEAPFGTHYPTIAEREGRYVVNSDDTHRRDRAVIDYQSLLRRRCARWMHERLPGAFAAVSDEPPPAAQLLTFTLGDPMNGIAPPTHASDGTATFTPRSFADDSPHVGSRGGGDEDYFAILGQRDEWDAWACVNMPGLVLRLARRPLLGGGEECLTFSTRVADFEQRNSLRGYDHGVGVDAIVPYSHWLANTLARYALVRLVGSYEDRIAAIRDRLGTVGLKRPRRSVGEMQAIERDLLLISRDARHVMTDVIAAPEWVWQREVFTFLPLRDRGTEQEPLFTWTLRDMLERVRRAVEAEADVRATTQAVSSLVAAAANLQVSRVTIRLTRVATAMTAVALVLAFLALPDAIQQRLIDVITTVWRSLPF